MAEKNSFEISLKTNDFEQGTNTTVRSVAKIQEALNSLKRVTSFKDLQEANATFSANLDSSRNVISRWNAELDKVNQTLKFTKSALTDTDKNLLKGMFQADTVNNYSTALRNAGTSLQWTGRQISVALTEPLLEFGKEAVNSFLGFNKQMTDIKVNLMDIKQTASGALAVDTSKFDAAKLNGDIKNLTGNFAQVKSESAGLINDLTQMGFGLDKINVAGIKSKDLAGGMAELASKMALIGHVSTDDSAKGIGSIVDAFVKGAPGIKNASDELARTQVIMNQLTAAATKGKLTLHDLYELLPELSTVSKETNTSIGAMTGILQGAAQAGLQPQQMVNALQQSLTRLLSPQNAKAVTALSGLRLHLFDDNGKSVGLLSVLDQLSSKAKNLNDQQLQQIFGQAFNPRQKDNFIKFLQEAGDKQSDLNQSLKQMGIDGPQSLAALASGEANLGEETAKTLQQLADQRFAAVKASPAQQFAQMKADLKNAMTDMGEVIAQGIEPILHPFVEFVSKVAELFKSLPGPAKSFAVIAGLILAAIGPIVMLIGVMMQMGALFVSGVGKIMAYTQGLKKVNEMDIINAGGKEALIAKLKEEGKAVYDAGGANIFYTKTAKDAAEADAAFATSAGAAKTKVSQPGRVNIGNADEIKAKYTPNEGESLKAARDRVQGEKDFVQIGKEATKTAEQEGGALETTAAKSGLLSKALDFIKSPIKGIGSAFKGASAEGETAIGGLKGGLGGLLTKIPLVGGALEAIGPAIGTALGSVGAAIGIALGPVLAIGAAIAAVIVIVVTHWKEFVSGVKSGMAPFQSIFNQFKDLFKPIGDAWNDLTKSFKSNDAKNAFDALGTAAHYIGIIVGTAFGLMATSFKAVLPGLKSLVATFSDGMRIIGGLIKVVVDLINGEWKKAAEDFAKVLIAAIKFLLEPFQAFVHLIASGIEKLVSVIQHLASAAASFHIPGAAEAAKDLGTVKDKLKDLSSEDFLGEIQKTLDGHLTVNPKITIDPSTKSDLDSQGHDMGLSAGAQVGMGMAEGFKSEFGDDAAQAFSSKVKTNIDKSMQDVVKSADKGFERLAQSQQKGLELTQRTASTSLDRMQQDEDKALERKGQAEQKALDRSLQAQQKAFDQELSNEEKAYDRQQQVEQKAYDQQQQDQTKAYDQAQQEQTKAYDRAQQDQQRAFDQQQQAQKDALAASQKNQLDAIDDQVKAIDDLTKAEEANLREEEYRTNRLQLLQKMQEDDQNYLRDRAAAIYQGKVDDARKLDMEHVKQTQDSTKQISDLDAQHQRDLLQQQRDAEKQRLADQKEALQAQFDAEKKSLDDRLQIEKDNFTNSLQDQKDAFQQELQNQKDAFQQELQNEKDNFQQQLQDQKDAYKQQLDARKQAFQDEQDAQKEALQARLDAEKEAQTRSHDQQKQALSDEQATQKEALQNELDKKKENLDQQIAQIVSHTPQNVQEMQDQINQIHDLLAAQGVDWHNEGESAQGMFNNAVQTGAQQLRDDNWWSQIGFNIVLGLLSGADRAAVEGIINATNSLPFADRNAHYTTGYSGLHSGGSIGRISDNPSDVPTMLQTGEYVIQRSAVHALGTTLLDQVNQGRMPVRQKYHSGGQVDLSGLAQASQNINGTTGYAVGGLGAISIGQLAQQIINSVRMLPTQHTGGLVKASRALGLSSGTVQKIFKDAKMNARDMLLDISSQPSLLSATINSGGTNSSTSNVNTTDITMHIDTFIGQREWFESMMKDYNIKVKPKVTRAYGGESRSVNAI